MILVMTTGCSLLVQSEPPDEKEEKKEEKKGPDYSRLKAPGELESVDVLREPGTYAGKKYDLKKVRAELDKISPSISANQLESQLIKLLAEDYRPFVKDYQDFDASVIDIEAGPGSVRAIELPKGQEVNVVILLDASGSMAEKVDGGQKMDLAKSSIKDFVSNMPKGANVSLQVYGHKGSNSKSDKELSCESFAEAYPLGEYNNKQFQSSLDKVKPAGWTPLAGAIEKAKESLAGHTGGNVQNIVYVVSDGIETCDGDPVAAAEDLYESDIEAVVNIIGFDVGEEEEQENLYDIANAGGGDFQSVESKVGLEEYFEAEFSRLYEEWQKWADVHIEKSQTIAAHKIGALEQYHQEMRRLSSWEHVHFKDALTYLEEERDFDYSLISQVRSRFYSRDSALRNYSNQVKQELQSRVRHNRDAIQENVRYQRDSEQEKLN
ncbi:Ca-activated chloride channel family protein [Desmospora activa DSM 45169]|uniref:Ca-activated chloride channel family protein n=1 Tax=Desmospora activa DSM 45169 TaxID=1121389 RepID=A0A2T4Z1X9_9BACL|nr:Ca-activated chloride channel family protein [Desmospora activa DSM 45169]